ncbi:hypothetical protein [Streptomyces antarcticus]|uniref:hypothetical protein n=1 Tax=Streptomyces antarcticus TaxID=2996458 RepID=UPI0022705677|nr:MULTISPECIES: hypothetical protein [unclassified Streptomyces]MCY0942352.1 hypothetical protein [Streptomyces sp. H34-AA3]MCZ4080651.1 hypothetical protein [Streptomyces sp. H34-S5]
MYHPVSIRIGLHHAKPLALPLTDPVHRVLWSAGLSYCSRLNAYTAPASLPVEQQEDLAHQAVYALQSLELPVAHFHHPAPAT